MLTNQKQETRAVTARSLGRRRILQGAGAIGAAGALTALAGSGIGEAAQAPSNSIVGTWIETITATDNSFPPFQVLLSFDVGGSMIATASIDSTPATLSGPSLGAWVHTQDRSFRWLAHAFSYDSQGNPNGLYTIVENDTLNPQGDKHTGSGSFKIVFSGTVTFSAAYTVVATRVTA